MGENQHLPPEYSSKRDELSQRIEGVVAAIRSAIRNDDQEWLAWLQRRYDELQERLAQEDSP